MFGIFYTSHGCLGRNCPQNQNEIAIYFVCTLKVIEFDDGSGSVLRIQPLRTHRDEAIYECTAANSAGEINTSAKLTVLEGKINPLFSTGRLNFKALPVSKALIPLYLRTTTSVFCNKSRTNIYKRL